MLRRVSFWGAIGCLAVAVHAGQVDRVVIIKVDGLPERLLERYARDETPDSKPRLSNIAEIFGRRGTWLDHFYVRGLSLSAPSWSLLDTGRHLAIRGNVEYDRYTMRPWDYLNFFPFYVGYAISKRTDMAGVEWLDQQGIPLLIDRFPFAQRYQSFQLLQRGVRWSTLQSSLQGKFTSRPVKDVFDEWQIGFSMSNGVSEAVERDILRSLADTKVRYLDYFTGEYDHVAHLTNDRAAQLHVLHTLDEVTGRLWKAISASPLADTTALVLVSDHGMNTAEETFSQGYDLVGWFNSSRGGAHHVIPDRHPMTEFKLKGLDPFVSEVTTPSRESTYLEGKSSQYPTVILDLDGNERANVSLRENALNVIHILLDQILQKRVSGHVRVAAIEALFRVIDRQRPEWSRRAGELRANLIALRRRIDFQQELVAAQPKKWTKAEAALGLSMEARRRVQTLESMRAEERADTAYVTTLERLLKLSPADLDPGKFRIEDLVPEKSLGAVNSIYDLQNYVIGPAPGGLAVTSEGNIDVAKSFRTMDYFQALSAITVRNNVQKDVSSHPVESIAVRVPRDRLIKAFPEEGENLGDGVWIWRSTEKQALVLTRHARRAAGNLAEGGSDEAGESPAGPMAEGTAEWELRYLPVSRFTEDASGVLQFEKSEWSGGFPLELFEDPAFDAPSRDWLNEWHRESDWFKAVHRTRYSNAIIGLAEEMLELGSPGQPALEQKRARLRTDFLILANDHWNFNVRGFNPGGNHGSFLRASTHSVLMFAGGRNTGIPEGLRIETPYDSLSFVPTILRLMGKPEPGLPGPVIRELFSSREPASRP
jgi:hypothetical protein